MADERANITISVNDEASAKLREISDQLESIYRKAQNATSSTSESVKKFQEQSDRHRESVRGQLTEYEKLGTGIRTAFTEGTRALNTMGLAMGPVTKSLAAGAEAGAAFARAIGLSNTAAGGIVATAGAVVAGMHLLSRSFTDAYQKAENFRRISLMDQGTIDRFTKARELVGMTAEQAQQSMLRLNNMMRDLATRGPASEMARIAREQMGPGWSRAINELQTQMQRGQVTWQQAKEKLLDYIAAQKDPEVRRAAAEFFHIDPIEIERRDEIREKQKQIIGQSLEMTEAQKHLAEATDRVSIAWTNLKTEVWNAIGPSALNALAAFESFLADQILATVNDIKNSFAEIKAIYDFLAKSPLEKIQQHQQEQEQDANQPGGNWLQRWWERAKRKNVPGMEAPNTTPQRFTGGGGFNPNTGGWAADVEGRAGAYSGNIEDRRGPTGEPIMIKEFSEEQRKSTDYLREIRDIMEWIRGQQQIAGAGGAGGGGAGAGVVPGPGAFAGGGGGTGGRTGSPWFGGPAGRGQPPSGGGGGGGGGDSNYNPQGGNQSNPQQGETPGRFATVRYNNPGGMYPGEAARLFGSTGTGVIGGGHKIAGFPTPVHGAAANFWNLANKGYVGKTIAQAMKDWSGGSRTVPGPGGKPYDPNMVITREMVNDPAFAIPFMQAIASGEAPGRYPMDEAQWKQAHDWFRSGAPQGQALARTGAAAGAQGGQPGAQAGPVARDAAGRAGVTAGQAGVVPHFPTGKANILGLDAEFVSRLNAAYDAMSPAEKASWRHEYASGGARTYAEQAEIYRRSGGGRLFAAAPPGHSRHESRTAVDVARGPALNFLQTRGHEFGLTGILGGLGGRDPVHIQMAPGGQQYYRPGAQVAQPAPGQAPPGQAPGGQAVGFTGAATDPSRRIIYADAGGGTTISLANSDQVGERLLREQLDKTNRGLVGKTAASRLGLGSQGGAATAENEAAGRQFWQLGGGDGQGGAQTDMPFRRLRGGRGTRGEEAAEENEAEGRPFWKLDPEAAARRNRRRMRGPVTDMPFRRAGERGGEDRPEDAAERARERRNRSSRLDVNVSAPKNTKVKADGGDVFTDVKVKQQSQMERSDNAGWEE